MSEPPLIVQLSGHLQRPVPERVRERARLHLLDWLACVAGARNSMPTEELRRWNRGKQATLFGNVLEMDDVHREARLHPGPVVWPKAVGRRGALSSALDSAVRGYEAMVIVGATLDDHHYAYYHPTATVGVFGAVAADAYDDLSEEALAHALALAGSVTGGLWQTRNTSNMGKQWHVEHVTQTAQNAILNADMGVTGPLDVLEGPQGLYAATCRAPIPMVLDPDRWRIEEVSFKPFAACRHAHPVIDAAMQLRDRCKLHPPFRVETYADALTFCDKPHPTTELEAKFSLQHAVALVADGRQATPHDFTPAAIAALAPLRAQVSVAEDPGITARYPAHFGARVNGFEIVDTLGDPERPVGEADIVAKMHMLAEWGGLPPSEADRAANLALRGDDAGEIVTMLEEWLS